MPERATAMQRLRWHEAHAAHCGCRPFTAEMRTKLERAAAATRTRRPVTVHDDTTRYNDALAPAHRAISHRLAEHITRGLPGAENRIWHGHPVWFLDGNPIVGYRNLKGGVRLLFWSGQSFDEPGLTNEGMFKAAEVRYTSAAQVKVRDLKRWLNKARDIQWDYKHIVKRRGRLERLV